MEEVQLAEPVHEFSGRDLPSSLVALSDHEKTALKTAVVDLEYPSFIARISDFLASPIELGLKVLPKQAREAITRASHSAIEQALNVALFTMNADLNAQATPQASSDWWHKGAVAVTGSVGGFIGFPSLPVEVPLSTMIILRSIADIARSEGEDLTTDESRLQCVSVFALGGASEKDDGAELGYFLAREAMATLIARTTSYYEVQATVKLAEKAAKAAVGKAAKAAAQAALKEAVAAASKVQSTNLVKFIETIASRYATVVSESAMAKAGPIIGAAFGGVINTLFISHFQAIARAHFTVRRLERTHGQSAIQAAYAQLAEDVRRERKQSKLPA